MIGFGALTIHLRGSSRILISLLFAVERFCHFVWTSPLVLLVRRLKGFTRDLRGTQAASSKKKSSVFSSSFSLLLVLIPLVFLLVVPSSSCSCSCSSCPCSLVVVFLVHVRVFFWCCCWQASRFAASTCDMFFKWVIYDVRVHLTCLRAYVPSTCPNLG